jgi:hypothetical protein
VHDARHFEEDLMQKIRYAMAAGAALFVASAAAGAQIPRRATLPPRTATTSPVASVPAGMCRIWIDGLPATRQPAPTDCATARARVPANGRIIYGSGAQRPVYGTNDRRSDPRRDARSSQYDPRLDRSNRRYDRRYDDDYSRKQAKIREQYLKKQQHDREQYERKMQKEQQKEWKKSHKGNGHANDHAYDHRDDDRDGNHDGRSDSNSSSARVWRP